MSAAESQHWVIVGRVGAAHGLRGWMRIQSYTQPPEALLDYQPWQLRRLDGSLQSCELQDAEWHGDTLRVQLREAADRSAAEALCGCEIVVERRALPAPGEREYYQQDLLGFEVRNLEGVVLGAVSHFVDAPAQPVMVVKGAREYWIPAVPPRLRRVLLDSRELQVDWPADF